MRAARRVGNIWRSEKFLLEFLFALMSPLCEEADNNLRVGTGAGLPRGLSKNMHCEYTIVGFVQCTLLFATIFTLAAVP